jgi:NTP pyrophosphatase (non-canonical NTP hydrolase)
MSDDRTTIAELRKLMTDFVAERQWQIFHAPKNLAMSLAIEAAELMEHFQWLSVDESRDVANNAGQLADVAEELADVTCYALALANALGIDLSDAVRGKMLKNAAKYPAKEFQGRFKKG